MPYHLALVDLVQLVLTAELLEVQLALQRLLAPLQSLELLMLFSLLLPVHLLIHAGDHVATTHKLLELLLEQLLLRV